MNDYRRIKFEKLPYRKFRPIHAYRKHQESRNFLASELRDGQGRKMVVVSHHAPSLRSIDPEFQNDPLSACYALRSGKPHCRNAAGPVGARSCSSSQRLHDRGEQGDLKPARISGRGDELRSGVHRRNVGARLILLEYLAASSTGIQRSSSNVRARCHPRCLTFQLLVRCEGSGA